MPASSLVLASTSRYRKELLARLQLPFEARAPRYDEPDPGLSPLKTVQIHATSKALSLGGDFPDALIIGSDQLAALDDEILGKPHTEERARAQLARLSGRTHRLMTALAVFEPASGRLETAVDVHELTMRPLSEENIRRYVERDRPLDCAGSYKLESLGIALFASIEGSDDTAVMGLPLRLLTGLLLRFGVDPLG